MQEELAGELVELLKNSQNRISKTLFTVLSICQVHHCLSPPIFLIFCCPLSGLGGFLSFFLFDVIIEGEVLVLAASVHPFNYLLLDK